MQLINQYSRNRLPQHYNTKQYTHIRKRPQLHQIDPKVSTDFTAHLHTHLTHFNTLYVNVSPSDTVLGTTNLPSHTRNTLTLNRHVLTTTGRSLTVIGPRITFFRHFNTRNFGTLRRLATTTHTQRVLILTSTGHNSVSSATSTCNRT